MGLRQFFKKYESGYSIIEVLVISGIMIVLIAIGGSLSTKFFLRRSVDNISNNITSQLNLAKLRASREGVEFRTTVNYTEESSNLQIITTRGDSNRNANFVDGNQLSTVNYRILNDYEITPANSVITFSPTGILGAQNTITIFPDAETEEDAKIIKCGSITVSNIGRISTTIGKWDFDASSCVGIGESGATS